MCDTARPRPEEHLKLVFLVFNRHHAHLRALEEDLCAAGMLGLVRASHQFDPARGTQFSTYAYASIRNCMTQELRSLLRDPSQRYTERETDGLPVSRLRDVAQARPVPRSPDWQCANCARPIDWDVDTRARKVRNTCATCERARDRAIGKGYGQGVCAVCASVIRSHGVSRNPGVSKPACKCLPEPPTYS